MSYIPQQPNVYQGKQVIINSDRILFNAKDDSIIIIADKSIAFNTKGTINFDTGTNTKTNKFTINSPNIHLGLKISDNFAPPTEPGVLGDKLEEVLNDLIDFLYSDLVIFLRSEYKLRTTRGTTHGASKITNFNNLRKKLDLIRKTLKDFKSNTVKLT